MKGQSRMKHIVLILLLLAVAPLLAHAQSTYRREVNEGNDLYREKKFPEAKKRYNDAVATEPGRVEGHYNLGNTAYRAEDPAGAIEHYKRAGERARSKEEGARLWYNGGNAAMKMGQYEQAVEAFKQSLKLNPNDEDARYNLLYAMQKLAQQQQQQKNQNKDQKQDQKKDQEKQDQKQDKQKQDQNKQDQNKQDQQKQDKDKQDQQQKPDQQKQDQKKQDSQQPPPPRDNKQMSKQQAEQILKALERDEKELQKKNREKRAATRVPVEKDW